MTAEVERDAIAPGTVDHPHAGKVVGLTAFKGIGAEFATVLVGQVSATSPTATNSQAVSACRQAL